MKSLISLLAALLISQNVFAHEDTADLIAEPNVTLSEIASVLSSDKTAPCLAQLHAIEAEGYDTSIGDYGMWKEELEDGSGNFITLTYDVIEGGDMVVGYATIKVNQIYAPQFGFPESKMTYVQSCEFSKDLFGVE